ncbi:FadR/GntR family transcriptional regulator [Nocardiopsis sp. MG754419]|uniref:FadR/GntR family transcriptional regulator n=1 Tax=Nocardiopsis sp. MG754419 TaxID=2259865 RepID=UPI001BAD6C01|nr:FCD domain-containing protein [Nocardiopsis sp. MG754419]MBR8740778.1 hypothetical protein [Nocardiopsis sp. MG754419]
MSVSDPDGGTTPPADAPRLRDRVVASLLELIRELELTPGRALPTERELAARLSVSRNVVRQAFDILEERGIVRSRRGSGRFLRTVEDVAAPVDPRTLEAASIADILEARFVIEEQCVVMACQRRTTSEVRELARLGARLRTWDDNVEFHVALAAATHNFMLERLVRQQLDLGAQLHQRDRYDDPAQLAHMRSEHEAIVRAVEDRDEERARALMRSHLRSTRRSVAGSGRPSGAE